MGMIGRHEGKSAFGSSPITPSSQLADKAITLLVILANSLMGTNIPCVVQEGPC